MKILTICSKGLVRSVALADVLKMHFEPVDVIPLGIDSNSKETILMLVAWADYVIAMHEPFYTRLLNWTESSSKILLCEVGPDVYHNSRHRTLVDMVWQWARQNQAATRIKEHTRVL